MAQDYIQDDQCDDYGMEEDDFEGFDQ